MFESLSKDLIEAREKAGISRIDASAKIRIDLKFLEAMEEGNFTFLSPVYVKAFLKDYAKLLDLDEKVILHKFYALSHDRDPESAQTTSQGEGQPSDASSQTPRYIEDEGVKENFAEESFRLATKMNKVKQVVGVTAIVVVILTALFYVLVIDKPPEIISERPFSEVLEENKKRFESVEAEPSSTQTQVQSTDSLTLRLKVTDTVWVRIIMDNNGAVEYVVYPGKYLDIRAKEKFSLHVGNSYAVTIELNGRRIVLPEKRLQVYKAVINKEGLQ